MIDQNGIEVSRSNLINSLVRVRDVNGNQTKVAIHGYQGPLIKFKDSKDSKNFEYTLPAATVFKTNKDLNLSLKDLFKSGATQVIKDAHDEDLTIIFQEETNGKYGWVVPDDFIFFEGNLIINYYKLAPENTIDDVINLSLLRDHTIIENFDLIPADGGGLHAIDNTPQDKDLFVGPDSADPIGNSENIA